MEKEEVPKKPQVQPNQQVSPKSKSYFNNLKNMSKNFKSVASNPYAMLKFQFYMYRAILTGIGLFLIYTFIKMIIMFNGGSNPMTAMGRAFMLLVAVLVLLQVWKMYQNMKKTLLHYEANPTTIDNHANEKKLNVSDEVDDIINKYGNSVVGV